MSELATGTVIGGRYRLESVIGEGGMASVWRAADQTLDRPVAIKFLYLKGNRQRDATVRGFLREARIAAAVRHRNVVDILDFGTHDDGVPFMVMELLEGETVQDRLTRGEAFSREEILTITARVLQGLAAVHDAGIVHRDLKPANIFLVRDRSGVYPKLLDFGISRSVEPESGRESPVTTKDGHMVGTPEYMSCEQARGLPDIDKRTDIYSMGVILYELLTGRLPFQSQHTGDLIVQIMTADPPKVHELRPEVGIPLSEVVARAMQRDRELRFPDIEQMHHAVIAIVEQDLGPRAAQAMSFPPAPFGPIDDVSSNIKIMGSAPTIVGRPAMAVPVASPAPAPLPVAAAPQIEQKPAPPARSWVWVAAGSATAVVVMVAAAFGFAYLWPKPPAASGAPRYIVVKSADETPRAEPPGQAQAPSPVASSETTATASTQPAKRAASPSTGRSERSRPKPVSAPTAPEVKLARAFAEQKAGIERCFVQYASELGQGTRLSVRIKLSAEGKVSEAEVSPANLAGAPLGSCIAQATRAMNFSPQPEPISFRVPLTAHRER